MARRRSRLFPHVHDVREQQLQSLLLDGPAWEMSTGKILDAIYGSPDADVVCAATGPKSKKKKFQNKRLGAKRVKNLERLESKGQQLDPEEATADRALAARANYLALDRPDISFSSKELCREFSQPSKLSWMKLKRLCRYLVHAPRLVWAFSFQDPCDDLRIFVDTDSARCQRTRRSTSGGCAVRG